MPNIYSNVARLKKDACFVGLAFYGAALTHRNCIVQIAT